MEPIKAIHIAPTKNMIEVDKKYNKGLNMLLTHLVLNDEEYRFNAYHLIGTKYLDNSFFELGYSLTPKAMIEAAKSVQNGDDTLVLICPDGTLDGMEEFKANNYKVMAIPKSAAQFKDMMYDNRIDYVGVSEEHIDYRHSPGARYELFRDHIDAMMPKKKIHLLGGTDSIYEIGMLHPFRDYIFSWDSSTVCHHTSKSIKLNDTVRKETSSFDFNQTIKLNSLLFHHNIQFVQRMLEGLEETIIPVEGTNGKYSVSNHGSVFSNYRYNNGGLDEKVRRIGSNTGFGNHLGDYKGVTMYLDSGEVIETSVHRLVAKHFCSDWYDDCIVNHLDGNPSNNYYLNLECTTTKGNNQHAYENGLIPKQPTKVERNKWEYIAYRFLYSKITQAKLAREYQVDRNSIHKYLAGVRQSGTFPLSKWEESNWTELMTDGVYKELIKGVEYEG